MVCWLACLNKQIEIYTVQNFGVRKSALMLKAAFILSEHANIEEYFYNWK